MEKMVGRNDPCPCGSGKKYKKCCANKNEASVEQLVDEELELVIENAFVQDWPDEVIREFECYQVQWNKLLKKTFDKDRLLEIISEYVIFVARRDLWKRYLLKILNGTIRSSVRSVLEQWQDPVVLLGKVVNNSEDSVVVEEILGTERFQLEKRAETPTAEGAIFLGVVLRDNRQWSDGIHVITGLLYLDNRNGLFEKDVVALAESSGIENRNEFYKEHLLDIYNLLNKTIDMSVEETLFSEELTDLQRQAVSILEDHMDEENLLPEVQTYLKSVLTKYLVLDQPGFRKPEILAAATFLIAVELEVSEHLIYTQGEIAKLFGVSVAAIVKHADGIGEYAFDIPLNIRGDVEEGPKIHYAVGTDPLITEASNWKMYCRLNENDFETFEETQAFINQTMNAPFIPKNHKQKAQMIAFEAYAAKTDEERVALAKKVLQHDPTNTDGLLLKAERNEKLEEKLKIYQLAIKSGEKFFDDEDIDNPWRLVTNRPYMRAIFAYGVALFEARNYKKAGSVFEKLLEINPHDNQGARYIAIASWIHAKKYEQALEILDDYYEDMRTDPVYLYLDWYTDVNYYGESSEDAVMMFAEAMKANPHVKQMLDKKPTAIAYPKALNVSTGSIEEAQYIWKLLQS